MRSVHVLIVLIALTLLILVPPSVVGAAGEAAVKISNGAGLAGDGEVFPPGIDAAEPAPFIEEVPFNGEDVGFQVADPLESVNRVFFSFNDKLYFWMLKPLARSYSAVVPKPARKCVGNFFYNLKMPIRLVNNLLQGKFAAGGTELTRFLVNSTVGVAGLWNPARNWLDISANEEDFGQTLGRYGLGEGFFICWPFLGPSNVRDTLGAAGDYFLDPISYLGFNGETEDVWVLRSSASINRTSLSLGDYEDFKNATFDPYSAMRDAYYQRRRASIKDGE